MKEPKSPLPKLEGEVDTSDAEAVLLDGEATLAIRLAPLSEVDREVKVNVDQVLEGLSTREASVLENVVDQEAHAEGALRPSRQNSDGAHGGVVSREPTTATGLPVRKAIRVQSLLRNLGHSGLLVDLVVGHDERRQTVLDEEDDLSGVLLHDLVESVDETIDVRLGLNEETMLEAKTLDGLAHLVDALFVTVVDGDVAGLGDSIRGLEHDGGLAVAGQTSDHRHSRTRDTIACHEQVHFLHARGDVLLQFLGHLDIQNVRLRGELDAGVETIDLHVVCFLGQGSVPVVDVSKLTCCRPIFK